jgi:hypothetical protein
MNEQLKSFVEKNNGDRNSWRLNTKKSLSVKWNFKRKLNATRFIGQVKRWI